jgi:DnaJ-class molecular chaperone
MPDNECPSCDGTGMIFIEQDGEKGGWGNRRSVACGNCNGTGRV